MRFELTMLAASCVLCFIHIVLASHSASFQRGYRWTASARDAEVPPLTGMAGRLEKALRNFVETFPVFVAAVFLVHAAGRETSLSEWGAGLYFSARLVYLPLYAFGVPLLRSLVWNVAFVGIAMLLSASVWPLLGNS
ncbi:hypothetical protein EOA27_27265 [Mesorhizobium sp. M2A.F.Ca.ET.037.01.1.1]|uniref:MAPEG family protein n=2 Tax=Mesorhizobium TaxID=68287 RepID=UPI000F762692|nr:MULTISPECIES: MAPEG family protein [unclassified Mesorhizobium]RUY01341.1 hypothetical protein EOA25_23085 [Mesorhizobium sp. M2A.F.Ca.ET.040.01.1.1]RVC58799.1 hypothetical protein EN759_33600 [Mesorhizobium sp. M00.F.Ca.ET.038.03.1.1]RVC73925.1 hypothetical protein EN766_19635 [Mesorhizobium sp. M2A.F.Ca.ET.046.02.1.1]AZO01729.1 hypothetical protein EJ068_00610 [Mesorhizobium sp. M2A.F.Ca.ET.043.02.1.1]AZO38191.1 hypothetical protein EJ072_29875 [Mesorhizobium sp. M2A.F.Ca.ET.046.03.2.1]